MFCEWCGAEVTYQNNYNGDFVCDECYEYAKGHEAVIDFIKAFPDGFYDYLMECFVATYQPTLDMLEDYRTWNDEKFQMWVASEGYPNV